MISSLIFFPEYRYYERPDRYGLAYEEIQTQTQDGVLLKSWFLPSSDKAKGTLLFLHGNAGNISGRIEKAQGWLKRGYSVFLLDYRGYGQSLGKIQKGEEIVWDAESAFKWLTQEKKIPIQEIIFYGESLGSYPAIRLAVEYQAKALILESPYTSFETLGKLHYAYIPGLMTSLLLRDFKFPNDEWISKIKIPIFILHGTDDEICPYSMGQKLYEIAPQPKKLFTIPGGQHNDLPLKAGEEYWNRPQNFIESE